MSDAAPRAFWKRPAVLAALGLAVLAVALVSDAALRGRVFYERDLHVDWYTQMTAFRRAIAEGSWPVWDNTLSFGEPLLADPSAEILYPPTWLNLLMPPWRYYTIFVVLHCWFGGLGVFFFCRKLRASGAGAFAGAALWVCSGPVVSHFNLWHHFASASWMGWVLGSALGAVRSPRLSRCLVWGLVLAAQILAGSADVCAMTWLLMFGLLAVELDLRAPLGPANRHLLRSAALSAALALGLSAAVWLPTLDVARRSSRWHYSQSQRAGWSLQPATLAGLVLPARVEDLPSLLPAGLAPAPEPREPLLPSLYLGLSALPLVAAALVSGRRTALFLATAGAAALALALGTHAPFYPVTVRLFPALGIFRYPSKTLIVVALCWAPLAALGLDTFLSRAFRPALLVAWAAALLALLPRGAWLPDAAARGRFTWSVACALCASLALLALRRGTLGRRWAALAAALAVADVFVAHSGMNRTAPAELFYSPPPVVRAARSSDGSRLYVYDYLVPGKSRRYLGRDDPYMIRRPAPGVPLEAVRLLSQLVYPFPPTAGRWGLEGSFDLDFRGLYPLPLGALIDVLHQSEGTPAELRLLRAGAVGNVVALHTRGFEDLMPAGTFGSFYPEPIHLLRVPNPLPRAYAVGDAATAADDREAIRTLLDPDFDIERRIVLPAGVPSAGKPDPFSGRARVTRFTADRVLIDAELSAPGYVVLVDAYDPGWRAALDGVPAPLLRANVAFRAVAVPPGRHVIEEVYRPPAILWGFALSGLSALLALVGAVRARRGLLPGPPGAL